jgi:predicted transcriptional regulator
VTVCAEGSNIKLTKGRFGTSWILIMKLLEIVDMSISLPTFFVYLENFQGNNRKDIG